MISGLGPAELSAHRNLQVREFSSFVSGATPINVPALLLGDFNCGPGSRELEYLGYALRWEAMLRRDAWLDHIYAYSLFGSYRFTPLDETPVVGRAQWGATENDFVSLSDHSGRWVRLRIEGCGTVSPTQ
jgi:endonuclease/exonuclease/phosphatase family metal-dependent hydrolase